MRYKFNELKKEYRVKQNKIECPVIGNNELYESEEIAFKESKDKAPIRIYKSTFVYQNYSDNLICYDDVDKDILGKMKDLKVKRDCSKMGSLKSEDALTWNVFRSIVKENRLDDLITFILETKVSNSKIYFWGYDSDNECLFKGLEKGREKIGESVTKGTEPDVIIKCDECMISIEAKYTSGNDTPAKKVPDKDLAKYDKNNSSNLLKKKMIEIGDINGEIKKYELARNWLLGESMRNNQPFYLINLTLDVNEKNIETEIDKIFNFDENHIFKRITWEKIYEYCKKENCCKELIEYFENLAYYDNYKLIKALNIE